MNGITTKFSFNDIEPNGTSFQSINQYQFLKSLPDNSILFEEKNLM